jgi:methionyl-tRNA formyltransferase
VLSIGELMFISLEFDRIVPVKKFTANRLYNIHFSLLPKYKGMYTSAWPLLNGETHSGVTLHEIDEGIDTGDIIDQMEFEIHYDDNCRDLYLKYIHYGTVLFKKNIHHLVSGRFSAERQPAVGASYYSRKSIDYSNVKIKLNKTAFEIRNQIRAFNFKEYQVPKVLGFDIVSADILDGKSHRKPGTIIVERDDYVDIATVDYDLRLHKNRDRPAW